MIALLANVLAYAESILNSVKYLVYTADASLSNVTTDSVIGHMMSPNGNVSSYDDTTDSLEATANNLAKVPKSDGSVTWNSTALASIEGECQDALQAMQLDHLCDQSAGSGTYPATVAVNSVFGHLMAKDGDISDFDDTTDSLEAISDKLGTPTGADLATDIAGIDTAPYTSTGTIVGDSSGGTPNVVSVDSSASANTFGSWVEVDASLSTDSYIAIITIMPTRISNSNTSYALEIGTGGAGAETTIIRVDGWIYLYNTGALTLSGLLPTVYTLPIPIKVISGTRIAIRATDDTASVGTFKVGVNYYQGL